MADAIEHDLRDRKAANLTVAIEALRGATGDHLQLTKEQAGALAVALTDARLVLGERLGLRTDEDTQSLELMVRTLDPDDPVVYAASIYDFLTWMQESLTTAMLGRGRGGPQRLEVAGRSRLRDRRERRDGD